VNESNCLHVVIAFNRALSDDAIDEQELALVAEVLSELLKEMIWQTSHTEE
jgi:hypothetical protein